MKKNNKPLILIHSYHHNNTQKIGEVMAEVLDAKLQKVMSTKLDEIQDYDLIGFGAGIDSGKHYLPMLKFAEKSPLVENKKAFIFSTSGVTGKNKTKNDHKALREILISKGYEVIHEFQCKGYNTNSILKYFGGMNRDRPNADDLMVAREFARKIDNI